MLKRWLLAVDLWLPAGQLEHYLRLASTYFDNHYFGRCFHALCALILTLGAPNFSLAQGPGNPSLRILRQINIATEGKCYFNLHFSTV